tara:strand:- start:9774 stop:10637 length:864 start_codon:yes stop_codon:yes gene_type:complete
MPELPEVEVVRRSLNDFISGSIINKVRIFDKNLRYRISNKLKQTIENKKIISIMRRGKFILIEIQGNSIIIIHLGMTGKILLKKKDNSTLLTSFYYQNKFKKKHNHFSFKLNNSIYLIYNDVRKFGFIKVIDKDQIHLDKHISRLGPEPMSKEFNRNYFKLKSSKSKKSIKNFMMDQKYISGLGNIYVNEILFSSSINPRILSSRLSNHQILKIISNTKKTLKKAIQLGGSSIRDFNSISGQIGRFQEKFKVYDRPKKSCIRRKCAGIIKKIYISNRSSFFCPKCQK